LISEGPSIVRLASFLNGYPFKPDDLGNDGLPVIRIRQLLDPSADVDRAPVPDGAISIADGDLVFSWSGSLEVRLWNRGPALLNQHLFRVDPGPGVERRWLRYVLEVAADRLAPLMHGSAMTHITRDMLRSVRVALPSVAIQRKLADFLDAETSRIDALIEKKLRVAVLLRERAVVEALELVLGRDGERAVVASGIDSIGEIPAHWRVARNKTFMSEVNERSERGDEELLTVSHITGVTPRAEKNVTMFMAESLEGYKLVRPGDLVVNTMWAWMGALGVAEYDGIVSPSYAVYRIDASQVMPRFVDALFRSPAYVAEITRLSRGVWTSRLRLYPDVLLSMRTPLPPMKEQRVIAISLDALRARLHTAADRLDRSVALLREHRQALVTAAITEQLNLTNEAA
jgi:type I restriction enzyme, S subunit